jgi:hypothetical protein
MSAAISAAREALATGQPDEAGEDADQTTPLRPVGGPPERPATIRGVARGAARSLLVTPWFAAGAGFVLAAGLWAYSPHTELKFPTSTNAPYGVPCTTAECGPGSQLATSTPSKRIPRQASHPRTGRADVAGRHAAISDLSFTFSVPWQQNGGFQALIVVRGKHVPATWRLAFTMPGTHIRYVIGAQWQPSPGGDGGTAFASQQQFGGGGHGQGQGNGQGYGDYGQDQDGHRRPGGSISILVMGSGSPGTPTNCVFDGSSCTFN